MTCIKKYHQVYHHGLSHADGIRYLLESHRIGNAIMSTINKSCFRMREGARLCQLKKKKAPEIRGLISSIYRTVPDCAGQEIIPTRISV